MQDAQDTNDALERQNTFYESIHEELEAQSFGKWAVVSSEKLVGIYDSNSEASEPALKLVPEHVCLVKHMGHVVNVSQLMFQVSHVPVRHL